MYQNLFDSHTHSDNSPDAAHSVTFMVEAAVDRGVQGIAVTDHCDCDCLEEHRYIPRLRQSALDVAMAREAFRSRVILSTGIELGQPHFDYGGAERVLGMHRDGFVLLALHRIKGWEELYLLDYGKITESQLHGIVLQYFEELLEAVRWGNFDSLAHLSLPLRYPKLRKNIDIDLTRYREPVDAVLRALVDQGKALEVNTSGLRNAMGETLPPLWVVERYRALGGELVTIGSDAHTARDIGAGVADAMQLLQNLGFRYFTFYRDRKPVMLTII